MADLTSVYPNQNLRDFIVQNCVDIFLDLLSNNPDLFKEYGFLDLFDINGGTQPPKSQFIYEPIEGYLRFLQIRDFSSEDTPTYIPIDRKNKLCEQGDILLGRYGASVGKILTGKAGAYNVACAKIIILQQNIVSRDFLFYLLHSTIIQTPLRGNSRSAQGGFNKSDLSRINILIPNMEIINSFVEIFKILDKHLIKNTLLEEINKYRIDKFFDQLISKIIDSIFMFRKIEENNILLDDCNDLITNLRQSILQEAVLGKLVSHDMNDEPANVLLGKIKEEKEMLITKGKLKRGKPIPAITDDEIPCELPKGWEWVRMETIIHSRDAGKSPNCLNEPTDGDKWGVIKTTAIQRDYFLENQNKVLPQGFPISNSYVINKGDILITRAGPKNRVGIVCLVDKITKKLILSDKTIRLRLSDSLICHRYISLALNSPLCRPFIESKMTGMAESQVNISQNNMGWFCIPLPPLTEQMRIVEKVDQLMTLCDELEKTTDQSKQGSEMLMQVVLQETFKSA